MGRSQRHGKYGTDLLIPWGTNVQRRLRKQLRHKGTTRFFIYLKATDTVAQGTTRGTPEKRLSLSCFDIYPPFPTLTSSEVSPVNVGSVGISPWNNIKKDSLEGKKKWPQG